MDIQPSTILQRLTEADRLYQREAGACFLCGSIKYLLGFVLLAFGMDVFLHLDAGWRLTLGLVFVVVVLGLAGWGWYLGRIRRNSLEHIARWLENRDPALGSKLINLLQLQGQTRDPALTQLTREMAGLAVAGYATELAPIHFERLAQTQQLRQAAFKAAGVVLAFALLLAVFFRVTAVEVLRFAYPYGDFPPYSLTQLEVLEPGPMGTNVLYGRSFIVKVKALGHQPKELYLTTHPLDHPEQATTVPMFDKGSVGYYQQLDNLRSDLLVFAHTKDRHSVSKKAHIGIILVPQLEKAFVQVTPPAYTQLKTEEKPYAFKSLSVLKGSQVRFRLQSNRPLREGALEVTVGDTSPLRLALAKNADQEVSGAFEVADSARLRFSLVDAAGNPSAETWEGALTATYDLPPEIRIVTPEQDCFAALDLKIEARLEATDDYGLKQVRIHRALNGIYSAPRVVSYTNLVRSASETVPFDFSRLGVQPGDVITLFAEAMDTAPESHLARSQTVNITLISVEDYNAFLLSRSDLSDIQGKYEELISKLNDLVEEQKKLSQVAQALKDQLAKDKNPASDARAGELDAMIARQNEINQKLNQQAERMENFVRKNPLYDIETELQEELRRQAAVIRQSTDTNQAATADIAQRSSPPSGPRQIHPALAEDFKRASDEQVARLGGAEKDLQENVAEPLQDMSAMQELVKDFSQFESLYQTQQELAAQARAYDRAGTLSREDQLALKNLAATQQQVAELMGELEQKLRTDAQAATQLFPKAASSAVKLADAMADQRLEALARQATGMMLAGNGEGSSAAAERVRSEMEKLFSQCQSGNSPGSNELDQYLSLSRSMNPGRNFAQMSRSRKFSRASIPGQGQASGQGEGEAGTSGSAVMAGPTMDVLGNESFIARSAAAAKKSAAAGFGLGKTEADGKNMELDKADVLKGLNPVNRQSGSVTAESVIEEYHDVVDKYFKAITK